MLKENPKYNNKVDIWSLGCIIYELCTLKFCFDVDDPESLEGLLRLYKKIEKGEHGEIDLRVYKPELQNIIDSLLKVDYKERPDIKELYELIFEYNKKFISENNNIDSSDIIGLNIIQRQKNCFSINKNTIKNYDSENNSEEDDFIEIIHYSGNFGGITSESKFWDDLEEIGEDILLKSKIIKIKIGDFGFQRNVI
jgi:serine/threonine protein kinase